MNQTILAKKITWDMKQNQVIKNIISLYNYKNGEMIDYNHIYKVYVELGYNEFFKQSREDYKKSIDHIWKYMNGKFNKSFTKRGSYIYGTNAFSWILKDLSPDDYIYSRGKENRRMNIEEFKYIAWRITQLVAKGKKTVSRRYFEHNGVLKDYKKKTNKSYKNHKYSNSIKIFKEMQILNYKRVRGNLKKYWINEFSLGVNNPFYFLINDRS